MYIYKKIQIGKSEKKKILSLSFHDLKCSLIIENICNTTFKDQVVKNRQFVKKGPSVDF